jgi:hypothetical protein
VSSSTSITIGLRKLGFFTSVSSNGTANPIIWALSHPANRHPVQISLYAFNPEASGSTLTPIFTATAGTWPNVIGNSNLVLVFANGQVFVASYKQLQFGLQSQRRNLPK